MQFIWLCKYICMHRQIKWKRVLNIFSHLEIIELFFFTSLILYAMRKIKLNNLQNKKSKIFTWHTLFHSVNVPSLLPRITIHINYFVVNDKFVLKIIAMFVVKVFCGINSHLITNCLRHQLIAIIYKLLFLFYYIFVSCN